MELRLDELLHALGVRAGALTDDELCDALWLASLLPATTATAAPPVEPTPAPRARPPSSTGRADPEARPRERDSARDEAQVRPAPVKQAASASLALPSATDDKGLAFRTPGAAALRQALELTRALRPFRRRVRSRRRFEVDEDATARRIVEEGLRLPVLRPARVRWFELAVVVDGAASMAIWGRMVGELVRLLTHLGAFRDVRTWTLDSEAEGTGLSLYAGLTRARVRPRHPHELVDPTGGRVIVVLTDGVAGAWHDGRVAAVLERWSGQSLTAIVSVLPERLWTGTVLRAWPAVTVRSRRFGEDRVRMVREVGRRRALMATDRRAIPIASLEPDSLATLARVLTGAGRGPALLPDPGARAAAYAEAQDEPDAAERVRRFDRLASPTARELARLFAAAPLSLPVMRLILRVVLPKATQGHLAEVFLGGLIEEVVRDGPPPAADAVEYDMKPGVRDELLRTGGDLADTLAVLHHVSSFIAERIGQPLDFGAMLVDPTAMPAGWAADSAGRAFARVASELLARLGGEYAALAGRLAQVVTPTSAPTATTLPGNNAPFRGEFVWVLGSTRELTDAQEWAARAVGRGLARHGFGVLGSDWREVVGSMLDALSSSRSGQLDIRRERVLPVMNASVVAAIIVGGASAAMSRVRRARLLAVPVCAFPGTGGIADQLVEELGSAPQLSPLESEEQAERVAEALFTALLHELAARPAPTGWLTPRRVTALRAYLLSSSPVPSALDDLRAELTIVESRPSVEKLSLLLRGARPEERAVVYLSEAMHPHLALFDLVVERVVVEAQQAVATDLFGAFILGLAALDGYCEVLTFLGHVDLLARAAIEMTRILRDAPVPNSDPGLVERVRGLQRRGMASPALWTTVQAGVYDDIRRAEPSSPERTRKLEALFAEVRRISEGDTEMTMATLRALFETGEEGRRAVAVMVWFRRPDLAPGPLLASAIQAPRSSFEQWAALLTAERWISIAEMHDPVVAAIVEQILDPDSLIHKPQDAHRLEMAWGILGIHGRQREGRDELTQSTLYRWRGEIFGRGGDAIGALSALRRADELADGQPDRMLAQVALGYHELDAGNDVAAEDCFRRALAGALDASDPKIEEARLRALVGRAKASDRLATLAGASEWFSPLQSSVATAKNAGVLLEWCSWLLRITDASAGTAAPRLCEEVLRITTALRFAVDERKAEEVNALEEQARRRLADPERADSGATFHARLKQLPEQVHSGLLLRPHQIKAIAKIEASLKAGHPRTLVALAPGSGKTVIAAAQIYRLLKFAHARKVLVLVDRELLAEQVQRELEYYTAEGEAKLSALYRIERLSGDIITPETRIVVATIQRVRSLLSTLLPNLFDTVVAYELQASGTSGWMQTIEHFDAPLLGFTSLPTPTMLAFFAGNLAMRYDSRQAVMDGFSVNFDTYSIVPRSSDREVLVRPTNLDDVEQLHSVVRQFRECLFSDLFPGRTEVPKTLIFAKNDRHADQIVELIRESFAREISFCVKITTSISWQRAETLLFQFKNSYHPRIAVTVDMLAMGVDIPALEIVVFMRAVKSYARFIQMINRGSRTISPEMLRAVSPDAEEKTRYVVVDCVGFVAERLRQVDITEDDLAEHQAIDPATPEATESEDGKTKPDS